MRLATLSRSIRIRSLGVVLVGFLGLVLAAGSASGEAIFDSISGNTANGSTSATLLGWKAAQFITPAASSSGTKFALTSVVLNLSNNPLSTDFAIDIYDSTSSGSAKPKSQVGRLVNPATVVVGNNTFTPDFSFPELQAGKSYWVVAKGGFDNPAWSTTGLAPSITPASQQSNSTAFTTNAGTSWTASPVSNNANMMTVNAVAVPEPSTWAMGLAGLGFAGVKVLGRRRRQG